MKHLIIYHANCCDGMGAAMAAHQWLFDAGLIETAAFLPMNYGAEIPTVDKNTHVIILDFSFKRHQMIDLAMAAASVTVFDHHKSAEAEIGPLIEEGVVDGMFDNSRSGAGMAWDELMGYRPELIDRIEDYDLWHFNYTDSEAIHEALLAIGFAFEEWVPLLDSAGMAVSALGAQGALLLAAKRQRVADTIKEASLVRCPAGRPFKVPVVNCSHDLASKVGEALSAHHPYAITFQVLKKGVVQLSFRSNKQFAAAVDVSEIAAEFGGGGHMHAAGARIPLEQLGELS